MWLVIPFGLANAPVASHRLMNKIFADLLDVYIVVYLDNILIYLNNLNDHKGHVKEVLRYFWAHKLYVLLSKYAFYQKSIKFLGFLLSSVIYQKFGIIYYLYSFSFYFIYNFCSWPPKLLTPIGLRYKPNTCTITPILRFV